MWFNLCHTFLLIWIVCTWCFRSRVRWWRYTFGILLLIMIILVITIWYLESEVDWGYYYEIWSPLVNRMDWKYVLWYRDCSLGYPFKLISLFLQICLCSLVLKLYWLLRSCPEYKWHESLLPYFISIFIWPMSRLHVMQDFH